MSMLLQVRAVAAVLILAGALVRLRVAGAAPLAAELVKDINTEVPAGSTSCTPVRVGAVVFLCAVSHYSDGDDLFVTDGTSAGTKWVAGPLLLIENLTAVNGRLFFTAALADGIELWTSDGTEAGTHQVKDIAPGSESSHLSNLTNVNGTLFFVADEPVRHQPMQLWRSDGTDAGTVLVKDFAPASGFLSFLSSLTGVGDELFFSAYDPDLGTELWKSDGTEDGTVAVANIAAGSDSSVPRRPIDANGTLFFWADDHVHGAELWKSDGTAGGTVLVKDINPGDGGSDLSFPSAGANVAAVDGALFFVARDDDADLGLWRSDGMPEGTIPLAAVAASELVAMKGLLFFAAPDGANGNALWKSDGTTSGTGVLKAIGSAQDPRSVSSLADVDGTLFFFAHTTLGKTELWTSDGTSGGTRLVELLPGSFVSRAGLAAANGTLLFELFDPSPQARLRLWRSDGTVDGTQPLEGLAIGNDSSFLQWLTNLDGTLMFSAATASGARLWKSNGTPASTAPVGEFASPSELAVAHGELYFSGHSASAGIELFQTDGTEDGTSIFADIQPGAASSRPHALTRVNEDLFFLASHPTGGVGSASAIGLWKSDGTTPGTVLLADVGGGNTAFSTPRTVARGRLFLVVDSHLWESDGTSSGTLDLSSMPGASFTAPSELANVNDIVFFSASDSAHGAELWKTDGTAEGTTLVEDIEPGPGGSAPSFLTAMDSTLVFRAQRTDSGAELWKSDGTKTGTTLVKDINPGNSGSSPEDLVSVEGVLFFAAFEPTTGRELWKSDGSPEGTMLVKDIAPGPDFSSSPLALTRLNGRLVFTATDAVHGFEPWISNGTDAGTQMLADVWPGRSSSSPSAFAQIGADLFFPANDGAHGIELWKIAGITTCGDGVHDAGEDCDDANVSDGDGCGASCRAEATPRATATATPSSATPPSATPTSTATRTSTRVPMPTFATPIIGECGADCDSDAAIGASDLPLLVAALFDGRGNLCLYADGNGDGRVSAADLIVAAGYAGPCDARPTPTPTVPPPTPAPCAQIDGTRTIRLSLDYPTPALVSAVKILLSYPQRAVSLSPPLGPRIGNRPTNTIVISSLVGGGLGVTLSRPSALARGSFVTVTFDRCLGATQPSVSSFACSVQDCGSSFGPVDGCTCTVSDE